MIILAISEKIIINKMLVRLKIGVDKANNPIDKQKKIKQYVKVYSFSFFDESFLFPSDNRLSKLNMASKRSNIIYIINSIYLVYQKLLKFVFVLFVEVDQNFQIS